MCAGGAEALLHYCVASLRFDYSGIISGVDTEQRQDEFVDLKIIIILICKRYIMPVRFNLNYSTGFISGCVNLGSSHRSCRLPCHFEWTEAGAWQTIEKLGSWDTWVSAFTSIGIG